MVYNTVGYHVVQDTNNPHEIELDAPFISTREKPFLSHGYYFWEKDLQRAHTFGEKNYGEYNYVICECKLSLQNIFDFVANPEHSEEYLQLEKALPQIYPELKANEEYPVGMIIDLLRKRNNKVPGIFPYDSVRAIYDIKSEQELRLFVNDKIRREVINLRPRIMICLFQKTNLNLVEVNIVYPPDYV